MTDYSDIINFRRINDLITTSGQPTEPQLERLKRSGVTQIVNLGPHSNKGALEDEAGTLDALGIAYTYIPVDFDAPTDANFTDFCDALEGIDGERTHVHCIYNARVSAFFYRYAKEGKGGDAGFALDQMDGIWRPGGVWAKFIGKDDEASKPNRYKGYEY